MRHAYVVVAQWPFELLSNEAKITSCFTGGTENHMGIFIPRTTADEIKTHSKSELSDKSACGNEHVAFDYMIDRRPYFQAYTNDEYYGPDATVRLYKINGVDAADIHRACVEVARASPHNVFCYRCNALCWCWPYPCWCPDSQIVAPSTCVALTMRIIARAKYDCEAAYTSDTATFTVLGMNRWSCCGHPWEPATLTGYSPHRGVRALIKAGVVDDKPVEGFKNAIRQCEDDGQKVALRSVLPLLGLSASMSRA